MQLPLIFVIIAIYIVAADADPEQLQLLSVVSEMISNK